MSAYDVLDVVQTAVVVMTVLMVVMMLVFMVMVSTFMFMAVLVAMFVFMVMLVFVHVLMIVMVVMVLASFLLTIDCYCHMRSCNPALYSLLSLILNAWDSKLIQFFYKFFWFWDELKECCTQHVSSSSHSAIDI